MEISLAVDDMLERVLAKSVYSSNGSPHVVSHDGYAAIRTENGMGRQGLLPHILRILLKLADRPLERRRFSIKDMQSGMTGLS